MDWFSWLSRTNLDPSLTYDYGVTFARNQLEPRDAAFFDHEFLQSMGISIAKHRLEILKLARKDNGPNKKLSEVIKKCLRKCVRKFVITQQQREEEAVKEIMPPEPNWYTEKPKPKLIKPVSTPPHLPNYKTRSIAFSGPLDGRAHHEKLMAANKVLKLSGPLDGRMVYANRSPIMARPVENGRVVGSVKSPRLSGPMESRSPRLTRASDAGAESPMCFSPYYCNRKAKSEYYDHYDDETTQWPALFHDLKPT